MSSATRCPHHPVGGVAGFCGDAMRNIFTSSRFWILLLIIVAATLLAALGKVEGNLALTTISGLLGGFGVGKIPGGSNAPTGKDDAE
jgi:hypothetical protein